MSALAAGRAAALGRMTSTARIRRAGADVLTGGRYAPGWADIATAVPCKVSNPPRGASATTTRQVGGLDVEVATRTLRLPVGTAVAADDLVEITAGELTGHVFRIIEATAADQQTALRVPVIAAPRPQEW